MANNFNNPSDATLFLAETPVPNLPTQNAILQACEEVNDLYDTCGLVRRQKIAMIRQGLNSLENIHFLGRTKKAVIDTLKAVQTIPRNQGGCEFGVHVIINLAALVRFFEDRKRRGQQLDPTLFGNAERDQWANIVVEDDAESDSDDDLVKGPGKLRVDDFLAWKDSLLLRLRSLKGISGVPLYYVVRPPLPLNHVFVDDEERQIYETRQTGTEWKKDNKRVGAYIMSLVQPTDGYEWVKQIPPNDGKRVFEALVNHYEGEGFAHRTIEQANATIDNLTYTNENMMSWESFSTKLKHAYTILEDHGVAQPLAEQLRKIRQKINTRNTEFNTLAKGILTYDPTTANTLTHYLTRVATHVASEFPRAFTYGQSTRHNYGGRNRGNPRISEIEQQGGQSAEYEIHTRNGRQLCNGVDVTDRYRRYPPEQWHRLPAALRREIFAGKRAGQATHGPNEKRQRVSELQQLTDMQAEIAQLRATVAAASLPPPATGTSQPPAVRDSGGTHNPPGPSESLGPPTGNLRRHRNGGASVNAVKFSNVRPLIQAIDPSNLVARSRVDPFVGYLDEDSHADMNVAGKNCVMLATTGYSCDGAPFHDGYEPRTGVKIVKAAKAYMHESGIQYTLS